MIFMMGAGGCPEAPVAEGGPSARPTGEPTGLVPRGRGLGAASCAQLDHIKKTMLAPKS
jgi:hypothetical protein